MTISQKLENSQTDYQLSSPCISGLCRMKKHKHHCIIRFHKEKKEGEYQYRNLLMLHCPWCNEETDLKGGFPSFEEQYESIKDTVHANEEMFSINADVLERAYENGSSR